MVLGLIHLDKGRGRGARLVAAAVVVLVVAAHQAVPTYGQYEFRQLVGRVPKSANAVVILNVEKALASPMGQQAGWKEKLDSAFAADLARVPPHSRRFVMAAQIDFEPMQPVWLAAVADLTESPPLKQLAERRGGHEDTVGGLVAVSLPENVYVIQLGPSIVGAMSPANRQSVLRWLNEPRTMSGLSAYLQKAAVYPDDAGTDIVMAVDLEGVLSMQRIKAFLESSDALRGQTMDRDAVTKLLAGVSGIRIGIKLTDRAVARLAVDFSEDATSLAAFARPLILEVLARRGLMIPDLELWQAGVNGAEVWLQGTLSQSGLRRLMSLVESPVPAEQLEQAAQRVSPAEISALEAKASLDHFRSVVAMFDDLKGDMKGGRNVGSGYFDKYARRIESLPVLNVNKDLLDYSAYVAAQMRKCGDAARMRASQLNVRQSQIDASSGTSYGYSGYGYYRPQGKSLDRRVASAEEKAVMTVKLEAIRDEVAAATVDIRRKMAQKYQVEF